MRPFAIAGIQMHVSAHEDNVAALCARVDSLMEIYPWVQMALASELAPMGPLLAAAQPVGGPAEQRFQQLAARHGIWLIPGSMFVKEDDMVFNMAIVIGPDGTVAGRYRKLFPFLPYETGIAPGTEFLVFDVPGVGRFGVSICYDMWFPETTRTLAAMGAEVILHPSLTNTIDRDLELTIARASAITNQCFFFDINGVADGGNGRSIIVGPAGDVLHEAGRTEEIMPIEIDLARVRRSREFGLRGLGQPHKSFRDRAVDFTVYDRAHPVPSYLSTLGPLVLPERGTRAGLEDQPATAPRAAPEE